MATLNQVHAVAKAVGFVRATCVHEDGAEHVVLDYPGPLSERAEGDTSPFWRVHIRRAGDRWRTYISGPDGKSEIATLGGAIRFMQKTTLRYPDPATAQRPRPLAAIALDIRTDWKNPYFGAVPYLEAMGNLRTVKDRWGVNTGAMIVRYFLSNATHWRGPKAREIKQELNDMVEGVY